MTFREDLRWSVIAQQNYRLQLYFLPYQEITVMARGSWTELMAVHV